MQNKRLAYHQSQAAYIIYNLLARAGLLQYIIIYFFEKGKK
jgi:hypothetical protein